MPLFELRDQEKVKQDLQSRKVQMAEDNSCALSEALADVVERLASLKFSEQAQASLASQPSLQEVLEANSLKEGQ